MNLKLIGSALGAAAVIIIVVTVLSSSSLANSSIPDEENSSISMQNPPITSSDSTETSDSEIMVTNGLKHIIPLEKIRSGGPPKDGIPSIDNPQFVDSTEAHFMSESDVVIGLEINGDARAYPLFILVWHEIVNDKVGEVPVAVTYCPLCYTNQVFLRTINNQEVEFGTSGKLYNSNLVMYDRLTDSYWSQALGKAITGELTGYELEIIPFDVVSWQDWKTLHPDTTVLTTDTGHLRSYGVDPYGDYYTDPRVLFPVENKDERMHPKEIILGFHDDGNYKAYKQADIEEFVLIQDEFNGNSILLISLYEGNSRAFDRVIDGKILDFNYKDGKIFDTSTNSEWNYEGLAVSGSLEGSQLQRLPFNPGFWFEWVAFHPHTQVYEVGP